MPRYASKTKRTRKSSRRNYRKRNMLSFSKAPLPNKFAAKLRYVESQTEIGTGAAGIPGVQIVSCNGCFDPDISSTGHQPRGFDQFMTMYDHYTVIGAKLTVDFVTKPGFTYQNMQVGIALKDYFSSPSDPNDYYEGRNVVTRVLPGNTVSSMVHKTTLSKTFSARKFLGISKPLSTQLTRGSASANPSEQAYFHIFVGSLNDADEQDVNINWRIEYLVVFTEPKQPTQS